MKIKNIIITFVSTDGTYVNFKLQQDLSQKLLMTKNK